MAWDSRSPPQRRRRGRWQACPVCEKRLYVFPGGGGRRYFCSHACAMEHRRESRQKEDVCLMCASFRHSTEQHHDRLRRGRLRSSKWRMAVVEVNRALRSGKKASCKTRRKMSQTQKRVQGTLVARKRRSRISKRMWARRSKSERQAIAQKVSCTQLGRIPDWVRFRRLLYDGPSGRFYVRSTWELAVASMFDQWGMSWQYEPRAFLVGKGRWRGKTYTPDFYLPELDLYIEVKGWLDPWSRAKMAAFKRKYPGVKLLLLQKEEMEQLGIRVGYCPAPVEGSQPNKKGKRQFTKYIRQVHT